MAAGMGMLPVPGVSMVLPAPPQHAHIRQEIRGMIPKLSSGRAGVQVLCARKARKGFSAHLLLEKTEDPVGVPVPWVGIFGVLSKM